MHSCGKSFYITKEAVFSSAMLDKKSQHSSTAPRIGLQGNSLTYPSGAFVIFTSELQFNYSFPYNKLRCIYGLNRPL